MDTRPKALTALAMHQQHIRRNQQHLKKHKQIEQVTRHKSARQAHELKVEQRMKVPAFGIPAAGGVPQHRGGNAPGECQHQGT